MKDIKRWGTADWPCPNVLCMRRLEKSRSAHEHTGCAVAGSGKNLNLTLGRDGVIHPCFNDPAGMPDPQLLEIGLGRETLLDNRPGNGGGAGGTHGAGHGIGLMRLLHPS